MLLDPQVNANALNWAADANKARTSTNIDVGRGSSLVRGVGPDGTYYTKADDRPMDVKRLAIELEELIAKLPSEDAPEHPRHEPRPLTARQLRPQQIEELKQNYLAGATAKELGERFGLNRQSVARVLRNTGIAVGPPHMTPAQIDDAIRLYESGLSLGRVAEQFSVDPHTIRSRLRERGVAIRDSRGRER
ncbi:MAG: hypothetical protein VB036_14115 [Propionicimonas sp.]|nr:hypothetical protein [Propionicimonas sp.]